ncbi:MAG: tRNA (adenosine(37)-N6)-dimethylallyltransferase MiaA [Elusimicrobia bacterium]|nr:tRNA (adenosine(37)-N6)-dimethylallyltransferase MiaA [Elusimicrobiota bacterium]
MKSTANLDGKTIPVIVGPTAAGKTKFATRLAARINGEIISADSRQIYRYLDVGTAKPKRKHLRSVRHHLIDFLDPDQYFDVGKFIRLADQTIADITKRGKRPIIVGGTGMYIKALIDGLAPLPERDDHIREKLKHIIKRKGLKSLYNWLKRVDPDTASQIDPHNPARVIRAMEVYLLTGKGLAHHHTKTKKSKYSFLMFGLAIPKHRLMERIRRRTKKMLNKGMIEETKKLLRLGFKPNCPGFLSLGYRHVICHLNDEISRKAMEDKLITETWQYAKRQRTWFKKDKRIYWLNQPFTVTKITKALAH